MAVSTTSQKGKAAWTPDPVRRRSMRVLLSVPIHVSGKTAGGEEFAEETRTLVVNAHGALISLAGHVAAEQTITLSWGSSSPNLRLPSGRLISRRTTGSSPKISPKIQNIDQKIIWKAMLARRG